MRTFFVSFITLFPNALHSKISFLLDANLATSVLAPALDGGTMRVLNQLRSFGCIDHASENVKLGPIDIKVAAGSMHEIAIKVDATKCSKVTWNCVVEYGSNIHCDIVMLHNRTTSVGTSFSFPSSSFSSSSTSSSAVSAEDQLCLAETCILQKKDVSGTEQGVYHVSSGTKGVLVFKFVATGGILRWGNTSVRYTIETIAGNEEILPRQWSATMQAALQGKNTLFIF